MSRVGKFFTGLVFIAGGIFIIPYYKQILDVLIDLIDSMFPGLTDTTVFVIHSFPLITLVLIFLAGAWMMISSLISGRSEPG